MKKYFLLFNAKKYLRLRIHCWLTAAHWYLLFRQNVSVKHFAERERKHHDYYFIF